MYRGSSFGDETRMLIWPGCAGSSGSNSNQVRVSDGFPTAYPLRCEWTIPPSTPLLRHWSQWFAQHPKRLKDSRVVCRNCNARFAFDEVDAPLRVAVLSVQNLAVRFENAILINDLSNHGLLGSRRHAAPCCKRLCAVLPPDLARKGRTPQH
jgi:hypothetical protein